MQSKNKYPEVRLWRKKSLGGRSSTITKGLIVDGIKMPWKEVEKEYGWDTYRFRKRMYNSPHWELGRILLEPLRKPINKNKTRVRESRVSSLDHPAWELERNRVARTMGRVFNERS